MKATEQMRSVLGDLVELLRLEAKELEKLVAHVEQVTGHLPYQHQFSVVASGMSALHQRLQALEEAATRGR
jgi:hypothetical protein